MEENILQKLRREYCIPIPDILQDLKTVNFIKGEIAESTKDAESLKHFFQKTYGQPIVHGKKGSNRKLKPLKIGVVFSGGQAAGGHNVIAGLFDAIQCLDAKSRLFGFLNGPSGIINNQHKELTQDIIAFYKNQGGFDLIGSGRTKIETEDQLKSSLSTVQILQLDGLVIIGGDDSNTNAAILAEYFLKNGCPAKVVGVPKTIDGDLKNSCVRLSFGFDTACKSYSEMIGNIARDALSSKKYYHFIKLMGRSASHITLECALKTAPNYAWISEEVALKKITLKQIGETMIDLIEKRERQGKSYGVILIPEGLIEFIPEVGSLIKELNNLGERSNVHEKLSKEARSCFEILPLDIQEQLLFDRDAHGNVQVSLIETEKLLTEMIKKNYKDKFNPIHHFFGYEGRSGFPSNFDCQYCYALGLVSALLIDEGMTGYMCFIQNLDKSIEKWQIGGIPLTTLMHLEERKGKIKPVIQKALVDLNAQPFKLFASRRERWALEDHYGFPGPIQFFGDKILTDHIPLSLSYDSI